MRNTSIPCLSMSRSPMKTAQPRPRRAAADAAATPCCPAPVSATRAVLPILTASSACAIVLLILWLPVCARSSRLSSTRTPSAADSRAAPVTGVGRLGAEARIGPGGPESPLEFLARRNQGLGDEAPAEWTEPALFARIAHHHRPARFLTHPGRFLRHQGHRSPPSFVRPLPAALSLSPHRLSTLVLEF